MRQSDLDRTLLKISGRDRYSIRDSLAHILALGTTGSGKSSTTIKLATLAMLKAGFGMLFMAAKAEDAKAIKKLCKHAGRQASVIEVTRESGAFNPLAWETTRTGGNVNSVTDLADHMTEIVRTTGPAAGKIGEEFWNASKKGGLSHSVPIVKAATGTVRMKDVLAFIRSAPTSLAQFRDPEWQRRSVFFRFFTLAAERLEAEPIPDFDEEMAERCIAYWQEHAALDPKTQGNIKVTLTMALSRFDHGLLGDMLCGETDMVPELLFHGAIIILNIPVQTYGEDAAIAQKIWKFCVQRACLTRNALDERQSQIPVAIIADECHNFLYQDAEFMAQCRSSLVSCVFATQSIPTIRAKIGGDHPHDRADHLISAFNTVVLHSSACPVTNQWFSEKIGKVTHYRANYSEGYGSSENYGTSMNIGQNWGVSSQSGGSSSTSSNGQTSSGSSWSVGTSSGGSAGYGKTKGHGTSQNISQGYGEQVDLMIQAGDFGRMLKTGGPSNRNRVSAVWFQSGRQFSSGSNAMVVEYQQ